MSFDWLPNLCGLHWVLGITLLFCFVYRYVLSTWWYFDERNVKFVRGLPFIGSTYRSLFGLENIANEMKRFYDLYPSEHIIGMYDMAGKPAYIIRDPEMIKQVIITNFDHFMNHHWELPEGSEPLLNQSLLRLRGERWRRMRSTMSPAFTGSKMRLMHGLIVDTTNEFIASLGKDVDADVIGNCAFGIKINSLEDKNNEFYECGRQILSFTGLRVLKIFGFLICPSLMSFLGLKLFNAKESTYFRSMIMNNFEQRIQNKIERNDMIDLLIKASDGSLSNDREEDDDVQKWGFAVASDSHTGASTEILISMYNY